ncbi:MAG: OmpA family protein [Methylococcales bacterium]
MAKYRTIVDFLFVVLLLGSVMTGGVFYALVLPKLQRPIEAPKPMPQKETFTLSPHRKTSVLQIAALPGTAVVRVAHETSNAHQAWGLANMGKVTDPGSLFARYGITAQFRRLETATDRIAALQAMAAAFNENEESSAEGPSLPGKEPGVHFFTIRGDESSWIISRTNQVLQQVNPAFETEIIGLSGLSAGEDTFLGSAEWKADPQKAVGGVVVAVPHDGAWNVLVFWCAENNIPFNVDQNYYDSHALNVVETESLDEAAELYINNETVERIFLTEGTNHWGRRVEKGERAFVAIAGVATRTPVDKHITSARGGLVTVASTKQYLDQTPQFIVGLKQWNGKHQDIVVRMLAALFAAGQRIEKSHQDVKAKRIMPKSDDDNGWQAAQCVRELFEAGSPDDWYEYYDVAKVEDGDGLVVDVGGVVVGDLQRNLLFFGLGQSGPDKGKVVYERFAQLIKQYEPDVIEAPPEWEQVFNPFYLQEVLERFPEMAQADPTLPTFKVVRKEEPRESTYPVSVEQKSAEKEERSKSTYAVPFEQKSGVFVPGSEAILFQLRAQIIRAGDARFEIHGYTDSSGSTEENLELSRRRCETIYNWLKEKLGTSFPADIKIIPHGESDLAVRDFINGAYVPALKARNRRVILKIFRKN